MQNLMKKVHNRKGFTLIELIIVIVIIAILAAIAIPAVSKYVGEAKVSRDEGNYAVVKSAAGAAAAYATTGGSVSESTFETEFKAILPKADMGTAKNPWSVKLDSVTYKIEVATGGAVTISSSAITD